MNKLELLSPAGDIEIFKGVINAGADAVYFGGDLFGARAYAKNFTIEEAAEAIKYAHIHSAKAYLTVNTLLKNLEIEKQLYPYLKAYVENGIDAFIVQDFGVFQMIKDYFPDVDVHASTQMSLNTKEGAKLIQDAGASRIVTSRELSISEIASIHEACPDLEIESFVHGALCVCYSGQCLMSSIIGGRSGNRGRCAQPCRLPYKAIMDNKALPLGGDYILSPKDFCTIEHLPEMIKAGVISFKIEGRMKQMSYATGVVSVYRHYLDQFLYKGEKNYKVSEDDIQKLLDFGNRSGFTDLYLNNHNGKEMITFAEPSHTKSTQENRAFPEKKLTVNCKVIALLGEELKIRFFDEDGRVAEAIGPVIEAASNRAATKEDIVKSVSQIGNTDFSLERIDVDFDDGIFLPVSWLKNTRREAVEKYSELILNSSHRTIKEFADIKTIPVAHTTDVSSVMATVLNMEQFKEVIKYDFITHIAVPIMIFDEAYKLSKGKKLYISLPTVIRDEYLSEMTIPSEADGVIASSYDGLGLLINSSYPKEKIILDFRLYTLSNRTIDAFSRKGISNYTASYELSLKELKHMDNSRSHMIIYSRIPLMVTANCSVKNSVGCLKNNSKYTLIDRKNESFEVLCNCDYCYNTIYNGKKYMAFGLRDDLLGLNFKQFRLDFTTEDPREIHDVCSCYRETFIENKPYGFSESVTKGHLKRGVE